MIQTGIQTWHSLSVIPYLAFYLGFGLAFYLSLSVWRASLHSLSGVPMRCPIWPYLCGTYLVFSLAFYLSFSICRAILHSFFGRPSALPYLALSLGRLSGIQFCILAVVFICPSIWYVFGVLSDILFGYLAVEARQRPL